MGLGMSVEMLWLAELHVPHGADQTQPGGRTKAWIIIQGLGFRVWVWPTCPRPPRGRPSGRRPRGAHKIQMQGA